MHNKIQVMPSSLKTLKKILKRNLDTQAFPWKDSFRMNKKEKAPDAGVAIPNKRLENKIKIQSPTAVLEVVLFIPLKINPATLVLCKQRLELPSFRLLFATLEIGFVTRAQWNFSLLRALNRCFLYIYIKRFKSFFN